MIPAIEGTVAGVVLLSAVCSCSSDGSPAGPPTEDQPESPAGQETTPPSLNAFDLDPDQVRISGETVMVELQAELSDPGSGVGQVIAQFENPQAVKVDLLVLLELEEGDAQDGEWQGVLVIPKDAVRGTWTVISVQATDQRGNFRNYSTEELRNAGFTVELEVQ